MTSIKEHSNLQVNTILQEKQEQLALATTTSETLKKLNVSIDVLPQKCQQLLSQAADSQASMDIDIFDPIAISIFNTSQLSEVLQEEYEILKLKQNNQRLQAKINNNNKFFEDLKSELQYSRNCLAEQSPNPDSIQNHIRQMRSKVASYTESSDKAMAKYLKLSVPDRILPKSLLTLVETLVILKAEAMTLQQSADEVALAKEARENFSRLRRKD
ncbi:uncharacterized protein LOC131841256 isoform X2 [Achroia grisella]|uniref:uncharacterized protein LOC131841256 isoform X2 n=1 Tax=Achroia grisella TaxID=688607 RepID=UPI0027D2CFEE|nr:uncharacterized protein LOC131841256 isoform X2 [Achroia grisella]